MEGYSCDCTLEEGCILITAESIESCDRVPDIPKPVGGIGGGRIEVRDFHMNLKLVSAETTHIVMTYIFDPKLRGPGIQKAVNFVVKSSAGKRQR